MLRYWTLSIHSLLKDTSPKAQITTLSLNHIDKKSMTSCAAAYVILYDCPLAAGATLKSCASCSVVTSMWPDRLGFPPHRGLSKNQ